MLPYGIINDYTENESSFQNGVRKRCFYLPIIKTEKLILKAVLIVKGL